MYIREAVGGIWWYNLGHGEKIVADDFHVRYPAVVRVKQIPVRLGGNKRIHPKIVYVSDIDFFDSGVCCAVIIIANGDKLVPRFVVAVVTDEKSSFLMVSCHI